MDTKTLVAGLIAYVVMLLVAATTFLLTPPGCRVFDETGECIECGLSIFSSGAFVFLCLGLPTWLVIWGIVAVCATPETSERKAYWHPRERWFGVILGGLMWSAITVWMIHRDQLGFRWYFALIPLAWGITYWFAHLGLKGRGK